MGMGVLKWVLAVLAAVLAAIAVKVGISFDLNRWREERHRRAGERLQALCTHTMIYRNEDGRRVAETLMISPFGRLDCYCRRCGQSTEDRRLPEQQMRFWLQNPRQWRRREKAFIRAYERLYKIPR